MLGGTTITKCSCGRYQISSSSPSLRLALICLGLFLALNTVVVIFIYKEPSSCWNGRSVFAIICSDTDKTRPIAITLCKRSLDQTHDQTYLCFHECQCCYYCMAIYNYSVNSFSDQRGLYP